MTSGPVLKLSPRTAQFTPRKSPVSALAGVAPATTAAGTSARAANTLSRRRGRDRRRGGGCDGSWVVMVAHPIVWGRHGMQAGCRCSLWDAAVFAVDGSRSAAGGPRSEERRVGKERGARARAEEVTREEREAG